MMGCVTTVYKSACPWCTFPKEMSNDDNSSLGAICGIIGSLQALEVIKIILGKTSLQNRLLYWNGNTMKLEDFVTEKNIKCKVCRK